MRQVSASEIEKEYQILQLPMMLVGTYLSQRSRIIFRNTIGLSRFSEQSSFLFSSSLHHFHVV